MANNQNKKSNCPGDTTESRADTPPVPAALEIDANRSVAQTLVDNTYPCGHKRAGVLEYTVDIMRYSLKIKPDQNDMEKYRIEFTYDAHVDGSITLYFFEIGGEDFNVFPTAKKLLETITVEVKKGLCKKFIHTGDPFDLPLHKRGLTEVYHLAIKTHATSCNSKHGSSSDPKDESTDCVTQSTLAVFEKVKGENQVRVTNQIIWVNGQMHVCHDFVGLCKPMGIERKDLRNNCLLCLSKSYPGIHRPIGNISLSKKEIGQGREGTLVFEGTYAGREAAVKRISIVLRDVANNEIQILKESDHPNIVRLYGKEDDGCFVYIALERCQCNLHELISSCDESDGFKPKLDGFRDLELWKANVYPSKHLLEILRDIVKGTARLHELGIFHRNLNPKNILIHRGTSITAKVSGMGSSKRRLSDNKSSLTESTTRQMTAGDLFDLGNLFIFCITGDYLPFNDKTVQDHLKYIPEAYVLISRLLHPNPESRPTANEVCNDTLFWDAKKCLSFIEDVSDCVDPDVCNAKTKILQLLNITDPQDLGGKWVKSQNLDSVTNSKILKSLESLQGYGNWNTLIHSTLINNLKRRREYDYDSVCDLLRFIRNCSSHYKTLWKNSKRLLGGVGGLWTYFSSKFPKLVMDVYKVLENHCANEELLNKYY